MITIARWVFAGSTGFITEVFIAKVGAHEQKKHLAYV